MRSTLISVALVLTAPAQWEARPDVGKVETLRGKIVPLSDLVARAGGKLDTDAVPVSLVLVAEDGKVYPLVKDALSRMFYRDKALLDRTMQVTGRLLPGSSILRLGSVHSVHKGELFEIYYWCDICSIKRGEKMICECCGGPMELKEVPSKR
ncbi:MAG: hypothetical protein U0840_04880 [Gemmataceae bacterium]